ANRIELSRLLCSICLDVFTDPVSTSCGHNFCKSCLTGHWDNSDRWKCPLCNKIFENRPDLSENPNNPTKVTCDACTGPKMKSVKMCLNCGISYYDQTCVCLLCTVTDHKTHNTVPIQEASEEVKVITDDILKFLIPFILDHDKFINLLMYKTQIEVQKMIQERLQKTEKIKESLELSKVGLMLHYTEDETAGGVEVFTALIRSIERSQAELLEVMEEKQKAAERQAEEFIKDLEQEITDEFTYCLYTQITLCVFLSVDVTLDPDKASPNLILSDDGKQVRHGYSNQYPPDNPKRFAYSFSVLEKEGFSSGRVYYEVQVSGKTEWTLGVARGSVNRNIRWRSSLQGGFWTVVLRNGNKYYAAADYSIRLSLKKKPEKVGVFVDYKEGLISFYDEEARSYIYSFTGQSFTGKLYPYFSPVMPNTGVTIIPALTVEVEK
uniref:Uncharacterized protein n=1 Tax=Astyanax mexicanus TaxID=7994 RepID=A0A3B1JM57_ASTMX